MYFLTVYSKQTYKMSNYPQNEVIDVLFIFGECHRNYRRAARVNILSQQYPDCRHPADRQIRNIERRSHRNPFYRQR